MEHAANAVACVVPYDAAAIALGDRLDDMADLGVRHAGATDRNRGVEALAAVSAAAYRAVRISFIRSAFARALSPTGYVAFLCEWRHVQVAVEACGEGRLRTIVIQRHICVSTVHIPKLTMSPSSSLRWSGMPWQITSFTDVHTLLG